MDTINGNDPAEIRTALKKAVNEKERPSLIIGKTIMGKGCVTEDGSNFERQSSTHGMPLSKAGASFEKTIRNLGGDPENPFRVFEEVETCYQQMIEKKKAFAAKKRDSKAAWASNNPELAVKYNRFMSGKLPELDYSKIVQKENSATRAASSAVLGYFADHLKNMVVASADLSNSDKTDGFLKKSKAFSKNDFSGSFLQMGVSELTMAAVLNGMALHGGVIPAGGTFFVFSDYMKPAVRIDRKSVV